MSRKTTSCMTPLPGGTFLMGSNDFYPEECPARPATVEGFWIDQHPVTNAQFARFVDATGYVTVAEQTPDPANFPDVDRAAQVAGSLVFHHTRGPVDLHDYRAWWRYVPGASWRYPEGPGSTLDGREDHPVVHVAYADAHAYAVWAGKELPTEAEWEYAARGGLAGAPYVWGDDPNPHAQAMANTWQGRFPWENLALDGYEGTSPIQAFPANGYGLYDMAGNVWEWTADEFMPHGARETSGSCCAPRKPQIELVSRRPDRPYRRRVVKGGSHLCAPAYCLRYRPAARQPQTVDTSTSHIGFRCIIRENHSIVG